VIAPKFASFPEEREVAEEMFVCLNF